MNITIDHNQISDKIIKNELFLYFPHDLKLHTRLENVKLMEWMNYWGFRAGYKEESTDVVIPTNFDLKNCFYKRLEFDNLIGLNIDLDKNLNSQDLVKIFYYKFLYNSGIVDKTNLLLLGYKEDDRGYFNKTLEYKYFLNVFNLKIDKVFYEKDLGCKFGSDEFLEKLSRYRFLNLYSSKERKKNKFYSDSFTVENISIHNFNFYLENKSLVDIITEISEYFEKKEIAFNCLMSFVFDNPKVKDVKISKSFLESTPGYIFYKTQEKVKDLGVLHERDGDNFKSNLLQYYYNKSMWFFNPKFLQKALVIHCNKINKIIDNPNFKPHEDDHIKIYISGMLEDLELGMKKLGMFV
jgi:hypothetical protein